MAPVNLQLMAMFLDGDSPERITSASWQWVSTSRGLGMIVHLTIFYNKVNGEARTIGLLCEAQLCLVATVSSYRGLSISSDQIMKNPQVSDACIEDDLTLGRVHQVFTGDILAAVWMAGIS